ESEGRGRGRPRRPPPGRLRPARRTGSGVAGRQQGAEHLGQLLQLLQMGLSQGLDAFAAQRGEVEAYEAVVLLVAATLDEAEVAGPVDEPDGAVVADHQG